MEPNKVFFITLGCRLNQAETLILKEDALKSGFEVASDEEKADIYLVNSCSVTDKAQKDTDKILKRLQKNYPYKKLVITGCGAKSEHKKYAIVVKNNKKSDLFRHLEQSVKKSRDPLDIIRTKDNRTRLMFKIQEGCNNFCSYCIVPYLRGRERSFNSEEIIRDLRKAENEEFKEIVLCGVNVGKYKDKDIDSAGLIRLILDKTKFPRIRLSSINPDDFSEDLVDLWAENSRLRNHFHISLQSGSDTVLARMGRKYNTKQYAELVNKLRKSIPDVKITTDVIVGFPGETEKEFTETANFIKEMGFLKVHVFRYSSREGTRAAKMTDQVNDKIKKERAVKLQKLESSIRHKILGEYIGQEVEVLFEQEKNGLYSGFTSNYVKVMRKSGTDLTNKIVKVKVEDINKNGLEA